jgi:hypothetical protein
VEASGHDVTLPASLQWDGFGYRRRIVRERLEGGSKIGI